MKQTAVEWLKKEIDPINKTQIEWHEIFDQAKEIEIKNLNDRLNAIYEVILQLHNNEEITGFSKRAYAQCLDVIEQFKNK